MKSFRRVFFIHGHKCGGTSLVEVFRRAGYRFPAKHLKGKPYEFCAMHYEEVPREVAMEGVGDAEFFATEWQLAPWMLEEDAWKFTILREPWERYVSGYRFDRNCPTGATTSARYIHEYRSSANYTKFNYYTRYYSGKPCMWNGRVTEREFNQALRNLRKLDAVFILGRGETYKPLREVGIEPSLPSMNVGHGNVGEVSYFKPEFLKRAKWDYRLWEVVTSGGL